MKIRLKSGKKVFEVEELNFILQPLEIKELPEKFLRSYELKAALFAGDCRLVEGEAIIQIKLAKILFSDKFSSKCYGEEYEKFFMKNFDLDTITWLDKDDLPAGVYNKLTGKAEEPKVEEPKVEEPKTENAMDLNKDGIVDKKDATIAAKVLGSRRKKR